MTGKGSAIAAALIAVANAPSQGLAQAQPQSPARPSNQQPDLRSVVSEASARSGLPERWIIEVIRAESNGNSRAVSHAGAQGLMQIMPATWGEIRRQIPLGNDPFDVHDNVMAGAFYLRQLYDRFGFPGCLAAYNAGPGRYLAYVNGRRGLPGETVSYVRIITARLGRPGVAFQGGQRPSSTPLNVLPTASGLFVRPSNTDAKQADGQAAGNAPASSLQDDSLFVRSLKDGSDQ